MGIHPTKPFADGTLFDDTYGMHDQVKRELCYQGMIYVTSFRYAGKEYGGLVIARNIEHAKDRALDRGLEEVVDGVLEAFGDYGESQP